MSTPQCIAVVDYGMGNLRSVHQAMRHVAPEHEVLLTGDPDVVARADRVVFPGQGAMRDCMAHLNASGLRVALMQAADEKPFLGICVGMQMLFEHSEEAATPGIGRYAGRSLRFPAALMVGEDGSKLKVPHMGWNHVRQVKSHPIWQDIEDHSRFYYVHSYFVHPADSQLVIGTTDYPFSFCGAVADRKLVAVQFHPEKSDRAGLQLLHNFVNWNGNV